MINRSLFYWVILAFFATFNVYANQTKAPHLNFANLCSALKDIPQNQDFIDIQVDFAKQICSPLKDSNKEDYGSKYRSCAKEVFDGLNDAIKSCQSINETSSITPEKIISKRLPISLRQYISLTPSQELRVVKELRQKLSKDAVVVIFGAPGSGKTEQMELALSKQPYKVFDLRNRFLADYFQKNQITDATAQADIKKKYDDLKNTEQTWISDNKETIIRELQKSKENIIVFDEFDMGKSFTDESPGAKSAQVVLEIAKRVRAIDPKKKVIFIIHEEGLGSQAIASAMKNHFAISPLESNVIRTGYITPAEEKMLLEYSDMSILERIRFMNLMQGHPSAYLPLIKKMANIETKDFGFNDLVDNAKTTIKKVYAVMEKIQPSLIKVFKEMAQGDFTNAMANKLALINSGFVDTSLFMTEIVRQILLGDRKMAHALSHQFTSLFQMYKHIDTRMLWLMYT